MSPSRSEVHRIRSGSLQDSPKVVAKKLVHVHVHVDEAEELSPEQLSATEKTSVLKEVEGDKVVAVKKEDATDSQLKNEPQGEDQLDIEAQYDSEWESENESDNGEEEEEEDGTAYACLLYTSPSPRDATLSRMPSSA